MADINSVVVEHIAPGIVQERATSGQFVILNITGSGQQTIQMWLNQMRDLLLNWSRNSRCCLLHDLSHTATLSFNLLIENAIDETIKLRPDLDCCMAFVLPDDYGQPVQLPTWVHQAAGNSEGFMHSEVFTTRREAMIWLFQRIR